MPLLRFKEAPTNQPFVVVTASRIPQRPLYVFLSKDTFALRRISDGKAFWDLLPSGVHADLRIANPEVLAVQLTSAGQLKDEWCNNPPPEEVYVLKAIFYEALGEVGK